MDFSERKGGGLARVVFVTISRLTESPLHVVKAGGSRFAVFSQISPANTAQNERTLHSQSAENLPQRLRGPKRHRSRRESRRFLRAFGTERCRKVDDDRNRQFSGQKDQRHGQSLRPRSRQRAGS